MKTTTVGASIVALGVGAGLIAYALIGGSPDANLFLLTGAAFLGSVVPLVVSALSCRAGEENNISIQELTERLLRTEEALKLERQRTESLSVSLKRSFQSMERANKRVTRVGEELLAARKALADMDDKVRNVVNNCSAGAGCNSMSSNGAAISREHERHERTGGHVTKFSTLHRAV